MSDTIRERLRELVEKATPGPWGLNSCEGTNGGDECWQAGPHQDIYRPDGDGFGTPVVDIEGGDDQTKANAALIVEVVNALPALLDELDTLERRVLAAERDRDRAIAHDTQPYPTAWAYEQVCKARDKWQARAEIAERALRDQP